MKIIIVGAGWYGLHTYLLLKESRNNYNITILEQDKIFFNNSSNFNQNRLHLGYHYPRSFKTRQLCVKGYYQFITRYRELVDFIDYNYYLISDKSFIDYGTYISIFNGINYQHNFIKNDEFKKIDGDIINTKEKIINSTKVKNYFKKKINFDDVKLNYKVSEVKRINDKILVNNELECDLFIDCTYNQLNLSKKKYIYELTISLVYERINFEDKFESLTIMDGNFFSLFPREISKKMYTLTHVKYTPLIKSSNFEEVKKYKLKDDILKNIIIKMEESVKEIYPKFKKNFKYDSYFTSYKCKLECENDSRECIIEEEDNIINVNCGKIIGIFEFEEYLREKINI